MNNLKYNDVWYVLGTQKCTAVLFVSTQETEFSSVQLLEMDLTLVFDRGIVMSCTLGSGGGGGARKYVL